MKPTIIIARAPKECAWVAEATVTEDKTPFSAARQDEDPQVAVYKVLHCLYSNIADHYKSQFTVQVTV